MFITMEDIKKFLDLKIIFFLKNKSNKKSLKKFSKKFLILNKIFEFFSEKDLLCDNEF